MGKVASVVFDCQLAPETIECIMELRQMRLEVVKNQIADLDQTVERLVSEGVIGKDERRSQTLTLQAELMDKLTMLEGRLEETSSIFADEIELYLDLLTND